MQATRPGRHASTWLKGEETASSPCGRHADRGAAADFVELKITETDPGVRGDTSGRRQAGNAGDRRVVRVPLFVGQEEMIKVDTRRRIRQPRELTHRPRFSAAFADASPRECVGSSDLVLMSHRRHWTPALAGMTSEDQEH